MTQKKPLGAAMIGTGDITFLHRPAYVDNPDVRLVALCDADPALLQSRARQWDVEKTTTDYREILADPSVDLVEVNTPHHLHEKLVVAALSAGKHVACQKPVSTTIAEAEAMIAARDAAGTRFRVLENFVFYPPYVTAKEMIDAGEIGQPLTIRFKLGTGLFGSRWIPLRSELWHMAESENGMGQAVFDDGYHKLSVAMHFFGEIDGVIGWIDRSFHYADEPAQLSWRYKDSPVIGSFDIAFQPNLYTHSDYFPADERIDIIGTRGSIHLTRCTAKVLDAPPLILVRDGRRTLFDDIEADWQASFTAAIGDFPRAIREGRDTLLTGERARDIVKFAYGLILAGKLGTEVHPAQVTDQWVAEELLGKSEARHG